MNKLILHIGLAKTGTTTLQNYFHNNKKNLEELGISYPSEFLHDGGAHHLLAILAKNGEYETIKKTLTTIEKKEITVISSEELSTLDISEISKLNAILEEFFTEIKIIITTRTAYSLLINNYKQQIREGYIQISLIEFWEQAKKHARFLRLNQLKDDWSTEKNSVEIFSTETGLDNYNGDIIYHFSKLLNKDISSFPKQSQNLNKSLSSSQIEMVRTIYYQTPKLWHPKITWDCRRFVYFAFQNISNNFKSLSEKNDFNFIMYEKLVFEDCCENFDEKQQNAMRTPPHEESHINWKNKKIRSLNSGMNTLSDNRSYLLDKNDRDLIKDLLDFYQKNENIRNLGPSVQLLKYKENK